MEKNKDLERVNFRLQRDYKKLSASDIKRYNKFLMAVLPPTLITAISAITIGVVGGTKLFAVGVNTLDTFSFDESIKIVENATSFIPTLEHITPRLLHVTLGIIGVATVSSARTSLKIKAGEKNRTEAGISLIKDMKAIDNLPEDKKDNGLKLANRLFEDEKVSNLSLRDKKTLIKLLGTFRENVRGEGRSIMLSKPLESYDKVISFLKGKKSLAGSATVEELVESHLALRLSSRRKPYCGCEPIK